jgi:MoaA/NifB/PqqE/SkfB family radical SAM enzyme
MENLNLKDFATLVHKMRLAQQRYFELMARAKKSKRPDEFTTARNMLTMSKELESLVDEHIETISKSSPTITPPVKHNYVAQEKMAFEAELKKLGDRYEEAKDCLHSMSILTEEMEHRDRLYEIIRELRDACAVQLKDIYAID